MGRSAALVPSEQTFVSVDRGIHTRLHSVARQLRNLRPLHIDEKRDGHFARRRTWNIPSALDQAVFPTLLGLRPSSFTQEGMIAAHFSYITTSSQAVLIFSFSIVLPDVFQTQT